MTTEMSRGAPQVPAPIDQDTIDIVWESLTDAVYRNDGQATGTDTARYLIEALAEKGMCVAPLELLAAAKVVLAGLNARIEAAPANAVPVFDGIAGLHDAIAKAEGTVP